MIQKREVLKIAAAYKLNPVIIEKDYVLGWLLLGIANNDKLSKEWVFKGGTCLKKCFFHEYRFSEDLDFTLLKVASIDPVYIKTHLKLISKWIFEQTGIEIPEITLKPFPDTKGKVLRGKIAYVGPLQQRNSYTGLKLDLSQEEFIETEPKLLEVYHPYNDSQSGTQKKVLAYTYEEIFSEKIRAFLERARPRDLYDVIHLFNRKEEFNANVEVIAEVAQKKLESHGLSPLSSQSAISEEQKNDLFQEWENMLAHQISKLDPPQSFLDKFPSVLKWLSRSKMFIKK